MRLYFLALFTLLFTQLQADCEPIYQEMLPEIAFQESDHGFLLGAEFLWWTVYQSDLDYAINESSSSLITGPGKLHFMDYDWDGGVRVYVGYQNACMDWDIRAIATYHRNDARGATGVSHPDQKLSATLLHPDTPDIAEGFDHANASDQLIYWTLDVQSGKAFDFYCNTLKMRPYLGVRLLRLDQDIDAEYSRTEEDEIAVNELNYRANYRGVGLNLGFDFDFHVTHNWGIYGIFSGSIVTGYVDETDKQFYYTLANGTESEHIFLVDLENKQYITLPGMQVGTGLYTECQLCDSGLRNIFSVKFEIFSPVYCFSP